MFEGEVRPVRAVEYLVGRSELEEPNELRSKTHIVIS